MVSMPSFNGGASWSGFERLEGEELETEYSYYLRRFPAMGVGKWGDSCQGMRG